TPSKRPRRGLSSYQSATIASTLPTLLQLQSRQRAILRRQTWRPGSHRRRGAILENVQASNRWLKDYLPPNRLTSNETSITGASLNSRWTEDGFPSTSLFLLTFSWVTSTTHIRLSTRWYPSSLLSDGIWAVSAAPWFYGEISI